MSEPGEGQQLRRLDLAEFLRAKELFGRAFCDYNLMVYAQPDDRYRLRAVSTLYGAMLWDCLTRGEAYVTTDFSGVAAWLRPGTDIPGFFLQARAGMLRLPLEFGLRGFWRLLAYDDVGRRMHHTYAAEPHWYLAAIGVEPAQQGRGIGSSLMRPLLAQADAAGVACWLDTHQEQNVRLYQRHGFEIAEQTAPRGHSITVYGMRRPPQ